MLGLQMANKIDGFLFPFYGKIVFFVHWLVKSVCEQDTSVFFLSHLFLCLQKKRFAEVLEKSFPNCEISEKRRELARNLLTGILRRSPRCRPCVKKEFCYILYLRRVMQVKYYSRFHVVNFKTRWVNSFIIILFFVI